MLRVKDEKLEFKEGKYYLDNELFNGVIYFVIDCKVESKKVCKEGIIKEDYLY